jgi:hypothetical protein
MLFFAAKMRLKIRWFALKTARAWCSGLRKSGKTLAAQMNKRVLTIQDFATTGCRRIQTARRIWSAGYFSGGAR